MGGAENVASSLCEAFPEILNWEVVLVTGDKEDVDFYRPKCDTRVSLSFNYSKTSSILEQFKRLISLRRLIKKEKPDLVIMFCTASCIRGLVSSIGLNCRTIACEHNHYYLVKSPIKRFIRNVVFMFASRVFLLTERDIYNYPSYLRNKIKVMKNPLGFSNERKMQEFEYKLLSVGRLVHDKGYDRLLKNISLLDSKYSLTLVGDGELRGELEQLAEHLGIGDRVYFVGTTKNVAKYYRESSLLLVTSRNEGLPMVICEANAFGLPVVSYDCETGPREMIVNGENGYLIEEGNTIAFNDAINSIASDSILYSHMSKRSYELAERFSIGSIVLKWQEECRNIGLIQ